MKSVITILFLVNCLAVGSASAATNPNSDGAGDLCDYGVDGHTMTCDSDVPSTTTYSFSDTDILDAIAKCPNEFAQLTADSARIGSATSTESGDSKTYTVIAVTGGFFGGPATHPVAQLTIVKSIVPDSALIPSKPTTFKYTCSVVKD